MRIEAAAPFELTPAPDGVQHAVKSDIQISVFPDVGEVKMKHRVGQRPQADAESRWLYIHLVDKDIRIYIHGTHVVVAKAELLPTFRTHSKEEATNIAFKSFAEGTDARGRRTWDTENNREVFKKALDLAEMGIRSKILSEVQYAANASLGKDDEAE